MKSRKKFRINKKVTQWINPYTGSFEIKPVYQMSEEELSKEGGLRTSILEIDRSCFKKTQKEVLKLKELKLQNKKRTLEVINYDKEEILQSISNSKVPKWDSSFKLIII